MSINSSLSLSLSLSLALSLSGTARYRDGQPGCLCPPVLAKAYHTAKRAALGPRGCKERRPRDRAPFSHCPARWCRVSARDGERRWREREKAEQNRALGLTGRCAYRPSVTCWVVSRNSSLHLALTLCAQLLSLSLSLSLSLWVCIKRITTESQFIVFCAQTSLPQAGRRHTDTTCNTRTNCLHAHGHVCCLHACT